MYTRHRGSTELGLRSKELRQNRCVPEEPDEVPRWLGWLKVLLWWLYGWWELRWPVACCNLLTFKRFHIRFGTYIAHPKMTPPLPAQESQGPSQHHSQDRSWAGALSPHVLGVPGFHCGIRFLYIWMILKVVPCHDGRDKAEKVWPWKLEVRDEVSICYPMFKNVMPKLATYL